LRCDDDFNDDAIMMNKIIENLKQYRENKKYLNENVKLNAETEDELNL
jgi:LPS O-antigen subunit length determinant protein (WzzB/FepE family)